MISLTLINTVCSSSKLLQKNKWLKNRGALTPSHPSKSVSVMYDKTNSNQVTKLCFSLNSRPIYRKINLTLGMLVQALFESKSNISKIKPAAVR